MNKSSFPGNPDISLVIKAVICFIVSTACLILPACSEEKDTETPARQTLLVYLIGDNNLYPYLNENLDAIEEGVKNTDDFSCNLLIYIDSYRELPYLYKIEKDKHGNVSSHIIKEYPEQNSADKEIMSAIIQDVLGSYPAEQTGLILGSHATSWFPQDFLTITSRSFGDDNGAVMEIDELAEALPESGFDYILFDACYMANAECVYELRNKTDYIVASSSEIMDIGFPYSDIIPLLLEQQPQLEAVANTYYSFYNQKRGLYKSASISVVNTAHLDELASIMREITTDFGIENIYNLPKGDLQFLEKLLPENKPAFLYDLGDYVLNIATDEQYSRFNKILENVVEVKYNTPSVFYDNHQCHYPLDKYSGLSIYIPQKEYPELDDWYTRLQWWHSVYE